MRVFSIRHRGLRRFFEKGETSGLPPSRIAKLTHISAAIDEAENLEQLSPLPGWRLHPLLGDRAGTWSITLTGNWRLTFRLVDDAVHDLDLEDYH